MVRIVLTNASFLKENGLWEDGELEITSRSVRFSGKKTEIRKNFSDLDQVAAAVENYEKKKLFRKSIEKWLGLSFSDGAMWFFKFEDDHFADTICRQIDFEREKEIETKRQADLQAQEQAEITHGTNSTTESTTSSIPPQNKDISHPKTAAKEEAASYTADTDIQENTSSTHPDPVKTETTDNYMESDKEIVSSNTTEQSEKPSQQKEKKVRKKKVNLMDATRNLVAETQDLLNKAENARKEADKLYDELKKMSQSDSDPDIDTSKIQPTNSDDNMHSETNAFESNAPAPVGTIPQPPETTENDKSVPADSQLEKEESPEAVTVSDSNVKPDTVKPDSSTESKENTSSSLQNPSLIATEEETFAAMEEVVEGKITSEENPQAEISNTDSDYSAAEVDNKTDVRLETDIIIQPGSVDSDIAPSKQSEEGTQEEPPLQGQANINFRKKFVHECVEFARACTEYIPEKRITRKTTQSESYLFDLMNVCYSQMDATYVMHPMPTYIAPGGKMIKCREDGIYADKLITAYEPFLNNADEYQNEVIRRSLNDSVGRRSSAFSSMQLLCLMPDVVDDFSSFFRNQLEINGQRVFQIPRSIALAYAIEQNASASRVTIPEEFLCLDYDGEEFMAIKIRREKDSSGEPVFVRMGRYPVQGDHPSYKKLALSYLKEYMQKYQVPFTKKITHNLIDTKILQHLLLSDNRKPTLMTDGDTAIDIWIDKEILNKLQNEVLKDAATISHAESLPVFALCSFGWSESSSIWNVQALEDGCKGIRKRFEEGKTLWEEYLPSLQLGVHQDGTFGDLELISEKDRKQQIASAFLGKTVEITIHNGTIVLNKGKEYYDLPLVREVYGTMNKEKLARFKPEEEFTEDQEVELRIYYTYGDVDSYRLIAYCQDGTKIESKWVDTGLLANNPPHYTPEKLSPMHSHEAMEIYNGFAAFVRKVKSPTIFMPDTLYSYRRDETKPYSRYLRELNQSGFPFRNVRNYFSIDNQTSEIQSQIQRMLDNGTFDCIADVLDKKLPEGHNLEKGTSGTFPNSDQGDILRNNLAQICCELGMFYTLKHPSVSNVVNAMKAKRSVQFWAPITAYVKRDEDDYGVWDQFSKSLKAMKPSRPKETIFDLRAISNVCYLTGDWIFELYHGPNGEQDIEWIIENIISVFDYEEWNKADEYNAWRIRDILELLLCICLLKSENPELLDCNDDRTKEIVKKVKKIDNDLRTLNSNGKLKKGFNSRIHNVNIPKEFYRVNKIVYCLVQTLSGGESVNLVGFRDD